MVIAPISYNLERMASIKCDGITKPLIHLFFVDDLKTYAPGTVSLKLVMKTMVKSSKATVIALRLQKCGVTHIRKGKL